MSRKFEPVQDIISPYAKSKLNNDFKYLFENVETQGKTIQDLVAEGQLTPAQYAELVSFVNGNIKSGEVDINDLDDSLRTEVEKINGKINKGEVSNQDIDKNNFKIDQTMISDSLRQMIAGDAPINAVPADGSITTVKYADRSIPEQKTTFIKSDNLWFGWRIQHLYVTTSYETIRYRIDDKVNNNSSIIPIVPGKQYTVLKGLGGDRFNVGLVNKLADPENEYEDLLYVHQGARDSEEQFHTFTAPENAYFAVIHTNVHDDTLPEIYFNEGESIKRSDLLYFNKDLAEYPKLKRSERNIFNGNSLEAYLSRTGNDEWHLMNANETFNGRTYEFEVKENQPYAISIPNKDNDRFRIAFSTRRIIPNSSYDSQNKLENLIYSDSTGGMVSELFVTPEKYGYLYLYLSTSGKNPDLQVEMGSEVTEYEKPLYIEEKYLPSIPENSYELKSKRNPLFNFYMDLNKIYSSSVITDYISNPNSITSQEVNEMYDNLVNAHSEKIEKVHYGQDDFGNNLYYYETRPINYYKANQINFAPVGSGEEIEQPKIIITAGLHGNEKAVNYSTYYFLRNLLEDEEDELMGFLLRNIKFVILPVCNPSGFDDNTRNTRSGIDLNRDFNTESASETKAIKSILKEHSDADFYFDFHTMQERDLSGDLGYILGYTITNNRDLGITGNNMYRTVGRSWQKDNPEMPQDYNKIWAHTAPASEGVAVKFVEDQYEIPSALIELVWSLSFLNSTRHSEEVVRMGIEFLTNMITGALRLRQ